MQIYKKYMAIALDEAEKALLTGDVPIGAVIVRDGIIIARAYNQVEALNDPTAHCEILAIRSAVQAIGLKHLTNCTLYITLEPCSMCAGAIVLARIPEVIFGASDPKTGACGSLYLIADDERLNHQSKIIGGIMETECSALLKQFFNKLRNTNV